MSLIEAACDQTFAASTLDLAEANAWLATAYNIVEEVLSISTKTSERMHLAMSIRLFEVLVAIAICFALRGVEYSHR